MLRNASPSTKNNIGLMLDEKFKTGNSTLIHFTNTGTAKHPAFKQNSMGSTMNPNEKYYQRNMGLLENNKSLCEDTSIADSASNYYEKSIYSDQEECKFNLPNLLVDKRL